MGAFAFDNSYARDLPGLYTPWHLTPVRRPQLLKFNRALAAELGLDAAALETPAGAQILAGNHLPTGAEPIAQAYAGHQFGHFSPQLGDGRALLLGEVLDREGRRRDIAFKGSGPTPYSRAGDGRAALGPVLREYLMGEAMQALGIASTRALAVVRTGEIVERDMPQHGAVLTRVAASHVRVGTFQFFAARQEHDKLRRLTDYVLARHYPELRAGSDPVLALLEAVCQRQAHLVAQWMSVGFIHGVMNTDNMTLSGETIDYGPCAFMDQYDPATVFSSIDRQGRYAYANQPAILGWNLARLAEALLPLIDAEPQRALERARAVIEGVEGRFAQAWLSLQRAKLGLASAQAQDEALALDWLSMLQSQEVDHTLAYRHLAAAAGGDEALLRGLFADPSPLQAWLERWRARLDAEPGMPAQRCQAMRQVNPAFVPRNHLVEQVLEAATERDDLAPFERFVQVLSRPFEDQPDAAEWGLPPSPEFRRTYRTFCGT